MGNEGSRLKGLSIDKTAVEANDFFVLYNASKEPITNNKNSTTTTTIEEGRLEKLSIFQAERGTFSSLWGKQGPVKHAIRNYMIYRHPYILKFIATWEQSGETHLATERVRPLTSVLSTLSDIQICLGLRTVLCGLIFLTEKALARHLNICPASIYITENGSWRLAGFEYVWKQSEIKIELIELLNQHRHKSAIDADELKNKENRNSIEQYAFAALCEEILDRKAKSKGNNQAIDCNTPHIAEFREYCMTVLQHKKPEMRPKLAAILLHPYFNHEFILIHSFLFELPLKSLSEKQAFFTSLVDRLRYFNENCVASQLTADLLSRMVLLDPTAQLCVTPYVLKTKSIENSSALFGRESYLKYVMPHIRSMFRLRDAHIRLILLEYFMEYVRLLTEEELKDFILPHLLVGINDTNDVLVAKTLRCLADLIPILGATVVCQFAGERTRLFSDGRPQASITTTTATHWVEPRSITPVLTSGQDNLVGGAISISDDENGGNYMVSGSPLPDNIELSGSFDSLAQSDLIIGEQQQMPPRLSPDGGEDDKSVIVTDGLITGEISVPPSTESNAHNNDNKNSYKSSENESEMISKIKNNFLIETEEDAWSDWETEQVETKSQLKITTAINNSTENLLKRSNPKHIMDDLNSFDIQIQKTTTQPKEKRDEFDFFKDMEPIIKTKINNKTDTDEQTELQDENIRNFEEDNVLIDTSRFAAVTQVDSLLNNDGNSDHGWDVEDYDDTNAAVEYLDNNA